MPMFDSMKEKLRKAQEQRERLRREQERAEQKKREQARRAHEMDEERERRIRALRIIPGEVKYRYAVLDTVRSIGYAEFDDNQLIDPGEATKRAVALLQDLAFSKGADAVIHAQYQVLRYTIQQRHMVFMPVYETHIFGTAIKVLGPPQDWESDEETRG
jgi:hypothetical protein